MYSWELLIFIRYIYIRTHACVCVYIRIIFSIRFVIAIIVVFGKKIKMILVFGSQIYKFSHTQNLTEGGYARGQAIIILLFSVVLVLSYPGLYGSSL